MSVEGEDLSSIWYDENQPGCVFIIDQCQLPFLFNEKKLSSSREVYLAIREMWVRGAPLIGVTAAFGMYLAALEADGDSAIDYLKQRSDYLKSARPTAVNLSFAVDQMMEVTHLCGDIREIRQEMLAAALTIRENEIQRSEKIGIHGVELLEALWKQKEGDCLNILTHCNAGWLACVKYGTALAPVYKAMEKGIPVHVWVDETRPRNQGNRLTAWELKQQGVEHTVIVDNAGGLLMQKNMVDVVIVGSDRTSIRGDVVNKTGTYLKALAAKDNNVPFYVALPTSSIDRYMENAFEQVIIEERSENEIRIIEGWNGNQISTLQILPQYTPVMNYGFDITPASIVSALITENGVCEANENAIRSVL